LIDPMIPWESLQTSIDGCQTCKSEPLFEISSKFPCRPPNPKQADRVLLISEAPPLTGGFWCFDSEDRLRTNLVRILRELGLNIFGETPKELLQSFLSQNLFLLQALKWPFAEDSKGRRLNFNRVPARQQTRLISHGVAKHLSEEIRLLAPRGLLAMGNAALASCRSLAKAQTLPEGGVETLRGADYELILPIGATPLNATFLPVDQNLRVSERAAAISADLEHFLRRMRIAAS